MDADPVPRGKSDSSELTPPVAAGNQPKGSKLDAKKRDEFQADLSGAGDWDISTWPTWTITGRVMPERCDVNLAPTLSRAVGAGGRYAFKAQVIQSHICVFCAIERNDPSLFQIADAVRSILAFPIDWIAFQNRGAYEIILDLAINNQTDEISTIPIFEPIFDTDKSGLSFDASVDNHNVIIPFDAAKVPELPTAVHDLTSAVRYPRRAFEHCRMAVEVMRRHFDPPTIRRHNERWPLGEKAMCEALRLTRKSLQALDALAARSRHGELVMSIDWPMRKRALEFAWELVSRFADHLQGKPPDGWKLLDVRFED